MSVESLPGPSGPLRLLGFLAAGPDTERPRPSDWCRGSTLILPCEPSPSPAASRPGYGRSRSPRRLRVARDFAVRFQGLRRELADYLHSYNFDRAHTGRLTAAASPPTSSRVARKFEAR